MDRFAQQHEAARLLAAAARQVAGDIGLLRAGYRRKPCPMPVKNLAMELLRLVQTALQLTAAAHQASREILAQAKARRKPAPRTRETKTVARATKTVGKALADSGRKSTAR